MQTGIRQLDELVALRRLARAALHQRFGPATSESEEPYRRLGGVTRLELTGAPALSFYVSGEEVALIRCGDDEHLVGITAAALHGALGPPSLQLRSRAGKRSRLFVYPEHGIALSSADDDAPVEFLEIFQPRSAEAYQRELYLDPGPFIR